MVSRLVVASSSGHRWCTTGSSCTIVDHILLASSSGKSGRSDDSLSNSNVAILLKISYYYYRIEIIKLNHPLSLDRAWCEPPWELMELTATESMKLTTVNDELLWS